MPRPEGSLRAPTQQERDAVRNAVDAEIAKRVGQTGRKLQLAEVATIGVQVWRRRGGVL